MGATRLGSTGHAVRPVDFCAITCSPIRLSRKLATQLRAALW